MSAIEITFLSSSILTLATGLVIVAINPWRTINRVYLVAAALSTLWLLSIFLSINYGLKGHRTDVLFWLRATNIFASFLPWSFGLIESAIINPGSLVHALRRSLLWFIAGCLMVGLVYSDSYIFSSSLSGQFMRGSTHSIHMGALTVSCLLILSNACRRMRSCSGVRLLELKFFVINMCLGSLLILASFIASDLFGIVTLRYTGPYVLLVSFGLTVWAICYHRVFDARQIFANLSRRLSTLMVLASCVHITNSYLTQFLTGPYALTLSACCGGVLATGWDRRVCRWLNLDAKQILAGPRAQITEWAREEADIERLTARFESFLRNWCQAESVSFHIAESREPPHLVLGNSNFAETYPLLRQTGYITPETLTRRRPDMEIQASTTVLSNRNLAALIAVPRGGHFPSCVVAFGHKQSLRPYTYPDILLLIELIELMDNILAQARAASRTAQIERMEAAAMMSRGLAHDLNNLATPVSSFLLHMETRVAAGTTEAEVLADAKNSIRVMQDYIRESLFFARQQVPDFHDLSMRELLTTTVQLTQARAQARGINLKLNDTADVMFTADRALMLRMMQNLVINGIDATPRGGQVTLTGRLSENDRVVLSVTDQGPGVPAELVDRIFEPYFTTKDTGNEIRGLGLGLAISHKISGLHRGELRVGRAPSGGAIFTFIAPADPARAFSVTNIPIPS